MMWVLVSAIALILGVIFYNKLEPDLPEWARVSVPTPTLVSSLTSHDATRTTMEEQFYARTAHRWSFRKLNDTLELSRDATTTFQYKGLKVDPPVLYIMCQNNAQLFIFADIKLKPSQENGVVAVTMANGDQQKWQVANGNTIYAPNSSQLIRQLVKQPEFFIQIPFSEIEPQEVKFTLSNLTHELNKFPSSCFN